MTDTTERAELLALADQIDSVIKYGDGSIVLSGDHAQKIASALRRLASQDQKPVGYGYSAEIQSAPGDLLHVCREKKAPYDTPLYLSPPPASGWDAAQVNADADYLDALESELIAKDFDMRLERRELSPSIVADHLREALSHKPAPVERDPLDDLVARFSNALLKKLKLAQANGRSGWEKDDWEVDCQRGLLRHLEKGDPRDVAAYCAFMWHHGWVTSKPAPVAANASAEARLREALDKRCYMVLGPHLSGWRLILGFNTLKEVQDAHETLYTPHASDCSSTPLEIAKANGLVTCLDETGLKITSEIYKACTDLKADACLLGQIGSWGDTLNDDDVLSGLKSYNEMGECFVPDRLHASDCDKQETTKSEGGVEGHARSTKADSVRGEAGSAPSQDGSLAQLAAGIESGPSDRTASYCDKQDETGMNWQVSDETLRRIEEINENRRNAAINANSIITGSPSDRTADVTVDELAMKIAKARIHSRKSTYIARALLDAFTVGRR